MTTGPSGVRAKTVGFVGTDIYAAPELYSSGEATFDCMADVYSFGVTAWHLTGADFPDCLKTCPPTFNRAEVDFKRADPTLPSGVADLLRQCVATGSASRPKISLVRDALAANLLKDKHRALAVIGDQHYRLDSSKKAVRIKINMDEGLDIHYNGLDFYIGNVSGTVYVNNIQAQHGMVLPGCCVIAIGSLDVPSKRIYMTFDVSKPEIAIP